jgi:hypothetical protein
MKQDAPLDAEIQHSNSRRVWWSPRGADEVAVAAKGRSPAKTGRKMAPAHRADTASAGPVTATPVAFPNAWEGSGGTTHLAAIRELTPDWLWPPDWCQW